MAHVRSLMQQLEQERTRPATGKGARGGGRGKGKGKGASSHGAVKLRARLERAEETLAAHIATYIGHHDDDGGGGGGGGGDDGDLKCDCRALGLHLLRDGRIASSGRRSEYAWERALDAERLRFRLATGAAQPGLAQAGVEVEVPMSSEARGLVGRFVAEDTDYE